MISIVRVSVLFMLVLMTLFSIRGVLAEPCVKKIFNRYCLGGLESTMPNGVEKVSDSDGIEIYRVANEKKRIELTIRDGRISAVTRRETPGSWLNFTDWKAKLLRLYGRGEDIGYFPPYASSRSSRLNAINAGKGYAHTQWQQSHWLVSVIWDHRDYISLRYELNAPSADDGPDEGL